uniref:membrane-associated kinase regulator 5 n=1 Tax=Erigeron canadensis TaxID=72917 RepID=UPI001CB90134|nr:membrane-associated kinase regulator 5 [Erigeron canadensis]
MDVLSLLKFWKIAGGGGGGGGETLSVRDYDYGSSFDDEESFFDLVLTDNDKENDIETKSSFVFVSPEEVFVTNNKKTPQSPFRILMLGLQNTNNKTKQTKPEKEVEQKQEEVVKIGALLKRDNSLRHKFQTEKLIDSNEARTPSKRFSKDVVNKYLNIMKPSKRSNEKSRFNDKCSTPSSSPASSVFSPRKEEKKGGRGAVFKGVRKHLGKCRSASAILQTPVTRSDDSALEQQNSIQGAILHCKKSYNSPSQDCCVLSRSGSAPSNFEEDDRSSI